MPGCKGYLMRKALNDKLVAFRATGEINATCYDKYLFARFRDILGGRVEILFTGSAPIKGDILDFLKVVFSAKMYEGYGMTETAGGVALSKMEDKACNHIGGPNFNVKFRLRDSNQYRVTDKPLPRGELCIKSPQVFGGYFKRPEKTKEAFDDQGWLLTGDVV